MQQELRIDTTRVQAMGTRWAVSVGELEETVAAAGLGLSCQASAAAVNAAHDEVTAFTEALATRVDTHATHVVEAGTQYLANETDSTTELAAVNPPGIGV
jgi:hypothetical protein